MKVLLNIAVALLTMSATAQVNVRTHESENADPVRHKLTQNIGVSTLIKPTKAITIGKAEYVGTVVRFNSEGVPVPFSFFTLDLDASGVTVEPIIFGNITLIVKDSRISTQESNFPFISTGDGCGVLGITIPCGLGWTSTIDVIPNGLFLQPCAQLTSRQTLLQDCVSIDLQFKSVSGGKPFSFQLVNGETFCTSAVTNIFVETEHQVAMRPQCDVNGFCQGVSVPVVLHALPLTQCE